MKNKIVEEARKIVTELDKQNPNLFPSFYLEAIENSIVKALDRVADEARKEERNRIDNLIDKLEIGCWFTFCCEEDLRQITTQDELEEALQGLIFPGVMGTWNTKEEALKELSSWEDKK